MSWSRAICALIAVIFSVNNAEAKQIEEWDSNEWQMSAYSNDTTGKFSHCAMTANYRSGVTLGFGLTSDYAWMLVLVSMSWKLKEGDAYYISYRVDNYPVGYAKATAQSENAVSLTLANDSALYRQFQNGRMLTITTAGNTWQFKLTGTNQALNELFQCTLRHTTQASNEGSVTNPFVAPNSNANAPASTDRSIFQAEAATLAANLLSQAKVTNFTLLPRASIPESIKSHDAVWVTEDIVGSIEIINQDGVSLNSVQGMALGRDASDCKGKFASGSLPSGDRKNSVIQAFSFCEKDNGTPINYIFAVRPSGGVYIISTVNLDTKKPNEGALAADPAREVSDHIREATFEVIYK